MQAFAVIQCKSTVAIQHARFLWHMEQLNQVTMFCDQIDAQLDYE